MERKLTGLIKKSGGYYIALCLEANVSSQGASIEEAKRTSYSGEAVCIRKPDVPHLQGVAHLQIPNRRTWRTMPRISQSDLSRTITCSLVLPDSSKSCGPLSLIRLTRRSPKTVSTIAILPSPTSGVISTTKTSPSRMPKSLILSPFAVRAQC